jgi:hypothetical protein
VFIGIVGAARGRRVEGLWFRVESFKGLGIRDSGLRVKGLPVLLARKEDSPASRVDSPQQVSRPCFRVSGFGLRAYGFGLRVCLEKVLGLRIRGLGFT